MAKKILFITSSYPFGSGENFLNPEIKSFSTFFDDIYIMPTYPRGGLKDLALNERNISYLGFPLLKLHYFYRLFLFIFSDLSLFCKLVIHCRGDSFIQFVRNVILIPKSIYVSKIVQKLEIDFIYTHWLSAPMQLSMLLHLITRLPYGVTGHRWDIVDANNFLLKFKYAQFIRLISCRSLDLLPFFVRRDYNEKIHVIYMGVEINNRDNRFLTQVESCESQKNLILNNGIIKSVLRVVCIANFVPVKGHKYLIEAIEILHSKGYTVYLDLIGGGELESEIRKQINSINMGDYIKLVGVLEHFEIRKKLSNSEYDVYCQPSIDLGEGLHEGIPVALMEAISFGLPCISTKTGSIPELIENNFTGILVEDKNVSALAFAIEKFILNPNIGLKFSQNALNKVNLEFNQEINNQKIIDLIESVEQVLY